MDLLHYHSQRPLTLSWVAARLRESLAPGLLHRRAALGVTLHGPWRPADVWRGAEERLVWTVGFELPEGVLLNDLGEERLGEGVIHRRQSAVTAAEILAKREGDGLVLAHSDTARVAYASVWRERHLAWSLLLQDRVKLVRCDGEVVMIDEPPPRRFPEQDRAGVLLAGLAQWLRTPIEVGPEARLLLADTLAGLTLEEPVHWLVEDGEWIDERELGRKLA